MGVARELLTRDGFDDTAMKLKAWCRGDLEQAALDGTTGQQLHTCVFLIRAHVHADTQENEGANSVIRVISDRCRNIGLPLLDARVRLRKALGLAQRGQRTRWADRRPHALALLRTATQPQAAGRRILGDEVDRFATAIPIPLANRLQWSRLSDPAL